uniref:Uncharacterized protein n=1 Tax=Steinernema glaseri TaxID=37863 RepID=A0A1I7ZV15_9BILA
MEESFEKEANFTAPLCFKLSAISDFFRSGSSALQNGDPTSRNCKGEEDTRRRSACTAYPLCHCCATLWPYYTTVCSRGPRSGLGGLLICLTMS